MPHALASFDRIFVINLASRPDRRREMTEQLRRIGLDFGVGGVERFDAVKPDDQGAFPSVGSRGCYLSHLGVLRRALALQARSIVVFEDDLDFVPGIEAALERPLQRLSREAWAMFYGGGRLDAPPRGEVADGCVELLPDEGVGTTHFYGLRGPVIAALADYLELLLTRPAGHPDGGPMHVDGAFCWFRRTHPAYRTLMAVPELGYQRLSRTDVHALRWYDRAAALRPFVWLMRRALRRTHGRSSAVRRP